MRGLKPAKIELSEQEQRALEKQAGRHTPGQPKAERARIILKAAPGKNPAEIGQELKVGIDRASLWGGRWLARAAVGLDDLRVEEGLADLLRAGAPSGLSAKQLGQIEPRASERPAQAGGPISQWTGRPIAAERLKGGRGMSSAPRHAARLLKKGGSKRIRCAPS
jgi:transposase